MGYWSRLYWNSGGGSPEPITLRGLGIGAIGVVVMQMPEHPLLWAVGVAVTAFVIFVQYRRGIWTGTHLRNIVAGSTAVLLLVGALWWDGWGYLLLGLAAIAGVVYAYKAIRNWVDIPYFRGEVRKVVRGQNA